MWAAETVPSTALNTLILERFFSTFNTFTLSVPIPKISLESILGYVKLPRTLIWVTNPVTPSVPIPEESVPTPVNTND